MENKKCKNCEKEIIKCPYGNCKSKGYTHTRQGSKSSADQYHKCNSADKTVAEPEERLSSPILKDGVSEPS